MAPDPQTVQPNASDVLLCSHPDVGHGKKYATIEALLAKRARNRKWQKENRDKFQAYNRRYRSKHPSTPEQLGRRRIRDRLKYRTSPDIKARNALWRKKNPGKVRAGILRWEMQHKDEMAAWHKKWVNRNREKLRDNKKRWRDRNPDHCRVLVRVYRKRNRVQRHPERDERIILSIYHRCEIASKTAGIKHEVDHIIPLASGGYHHHLNLQILPHKINHEKSGNPFWTSDEYLDWRDVPKYLWPPQLVPVYELFLRMNGRQLKSKAEAA